MTVMSLNVKLSNQCAYWLRICSCSAVNAANEQKQVRHAVVQLVCVPRWVVNHLKHFDRI